MYRFSAAQIKQRLCEVDRACQSEVESLRNVEAAFSAEHESESARLSEERSHLAEERSSFHQQELSLDSAVYSAQIESLAEGSMGATGVARDAAANQFADDFGIPSGLVARLAEAVEIDRVRVPDSPICLSSRPGLDTMARDSPGLANHIYMMCIQNLAHRVQHVSNRILEKRSLPV